MHKKKNINKKCTCVHTAESDKHESRCHKVVEWCGAECVRVVERPRPVITEPGDVILKVTTATICGSDLHMYLNLVPGMEKGDIMGHEFMGLVAETGPDVKDFQVGDRVVCSAVIACGNCFYCQNGWFSCCDNTNPSDLMEKYYNQKIGGVFGYTHLTGGFDGGQAEYVRVPLADNNLLKIPDSLPDEKALFLSDIVCTGWHANELGEVSKGQTVAVWGCGPVGLMAQAWAKFRGARVIAIDNVPYRLQLAHERLGSLTINFDEENVLDVLEELAPGGVDVGIEAAGFRFPKTFLHKLQNLVKLEDDSSDILTEQIMAVRKMGNIAIVGDYFGKTNQFPIGALMEKGITLRGAQVFVQKYWKELLGYIEKGQFDPTFVISHHMALEDAPLAYQMFHHMDDNALKIILHVSDPTLEDEERKRGGQEGRERERGGWTPTQHPQRK